MLLYLIPLITRDHNKTGNEMAQTNLFKEFIPENEPISAYLERMELFFHAHEVASKKHVAVLLSNIGSRPYGVLHSLAVPKTPKELKYADIERILKTTISQHH